MTISTYINSNTITYSDSFILLSLKYIKISHTFYHNSKISSIKINRQGIASPDIALLSFSHSILLCKIKTHEIIFIHSIYEFIIHLHLKFLKQTSIFIVFSENSLHPRIHDNILFIFLNAAYICRIWHLERLYKVIISLIFVYFIFIKV